MKLDNAVIKNIEKVDGENAEETYEKEKITFGGDKFKGNITFDDKVQCEFGAGDQVSIEIKRLNKRLDEVKP